MFYSRTVDPEDAPVQPTRIMIEFKDGIPVQVQNLDDGTMEIKLCIVLVF